MTLHSDFGRLAEFLQKLSSETYPEIPAEPHTTITRKMVQWIIASGALPLNGKVLDVGCGQGTALDLFERGGYSASGVALNAEDVAVCRAKGFDVRQMDQSFLDFRDGEFDLVWCRHCLEHSIFPYFTLAGFERVLRSGGWLYVEVPAPDTACAHQKNRNHYSVLGKSMWIELLTRSGFAVVNAINLQFTVSAGEDLYWVFLGRKSR